METRNVTVGQRVHGSWAGKRSAALKWAAFAAGAFLLAACSSTNDAGALTQAASSPLASQTLRSGDVVKVSFPGSPTLNTTQTIRPDGRISMEIVGEVMAAGLTPSDLEKDLLQRYSGQLVDKEVTVTVVSSSFPVFVSGAVIKPGKIDSDHPITALEAVMEAGGFDAERADTRAVVVIREEDGRSKNYTLNLQRVLDGKSTESFYLRPSDIIYVPQRFSWF
ncbi:MAG TPA: polysaccharide biosynthesis/export family protein [Opitutaceae bacterium]|jgi:protein involved in polysaccharide export with SLBB domain